MVAMVATFGVDPDDVADEPQVPPLEERQQLVMHRWMRAELPRNSVTAPVADWHRWDGADHVLRITHADFGMVDHNPFTQPSRIVRL
jgi:hypothetical protein